MYGNITELTFEKVKYRMYMFLSRRNITGESTYKQRRHSAHEASTFPPIATFVENGGCDKNEEAREVKWYKEHILAAALSTYEHARSFRREKKEANIKGARWGRTPTPVVNRRPVNETRLRYLLPIEEPPPAASSSVVCPWLMAPTSYFPRAPP